MVEGVLGIIGLKGCSILAIPEEWLQVHRVVASAMSRHTFALVQPSKLGVKNRELATGVGVKWREQYLVLTVGHPEIINGQGKLKAISTTARVFGAAEFPATTTGWPVALGWSQ